MIDLFIGKPPSANRHMDADPSPVPQMVRQLLRAARIMRSERRKNTSDRRHLEDPDYIVEISNPKSERRVALDRRQKLEFIINKGRASERRRKRFDRRRLVNDGIHIKLSSKNDNRSGIDRRDNVRM